MKVWGVWKVRKVLLTLEIEIYRCTFVHMENRFENGFRKLIAWQEAHALTLLIYHTTAHFPIEERYGITSQLRRAASSIAAQIAEGSRMETSAHRKSYYDRAYASAAEVDNFLQLSNDLRFLPNDQYRSLINKLNCVSFLVHRLSSSCHSKKQTVKPSLPS